MNILDTRILGILGWTLLHFLWEGLILGLLAWGALAVARKRSAEFRYFLACSALALMVLAFLGTLLALSRAVSPHSAEVWFQATIQEIVAWGENTMHRSRLDAWLPSLVLVWLAGALLMAVRLGFGLAWLHWNCLKASRPVGAFWDRQIQLLARESGLSSPPRLRLSDRVDSPVVIGCLKPVILLPASVLTGLEPLALEAILLHELAHIRRWDYLVNLFQSLAEILFFYHPAFWWISRQIRREREHCCDDAAAFRCGDSLRYASALAALEALRLPTTHSIRLAPGAKGGNLMLRIRRLITPEAAVRSTPTLLSLSSILALGALMLLLCQPLRALSSDQKQAQPLMVPFSKVKVVTRPDPPEYPAEAKAKGIQGTLEVRVSIDVNGVPTEAKAISGPEELRPVAEAYAIEWRFKPIKSKGKAVPAVFMLTMPFRLRNSGK